MFAFVENLTENSTVRRERTLLVLPYAVGVLYRHVRFSGFRPRADRRTDDVYRTILCDLHGFVKTFPWRRCFFVA